MRTVASYSSIEPMEPTTETHARWLDLIIHRYKIKIWSQDERSEYRDRILVYDDDNDDDGDG